MTDKQISAELSGPGSAVYERHQHGPERREEQIRPNVHFDLIQRFPTRLITIKLIVTTAGPIVDAITVVGIEIRRRDSHHQSWPAEPTDTWTPKTASVPRAVRRAIEDDFRHAWDLFTLGYDSDLQRIMTGKLGQKPGYQQPAPRPDPPPRPPEVVH